jgi:hypothetical protein
VPGASVTHDRRRHDPDRAGSRDQYVLAEHGKRHRGMNRVPERIEDRRDVAIDPVRVMPDVRRRQRHELGKRARSLHSKSARVRAQMAPSRHAVTAAAADDVPLAADDLPDDMTTHT